MDDTQISELKEKIRLLIVEDETAIRNSMAEYMQAMGFVTYMVESAEEALQDVFRAKDGNK